MNLDLLPDMADALLAKLLAAFPTGIADHADTNAPPVGYVEHVGPPNIGPVADGCDRLVVYVNPMRLAKMRQKGGTPGNTPMVRQITFMVELQRCGAPSPTVIRNTAAPPSTAAIDAFGKRLLRDGAILLNALASGVRTATLFGEAHPSCTSVVVGDLAPVGPNGKVAQWRVPVVVEL